MKYFTKLLMLGILITFFTSGCATITQKTPAPTRSWQARQALLTKLESWQIKGKIGIQTAQDAGSANVEWLQHQNDYTLTLLGPLGAVQMTLIGAPHGVLLKTAEGKTYQANNAEQLLDQQWHWRLPVSYLHYWIKGLPSPASHYEAVFDDKNRITELRQHGWIIHYLSYEANQSIDLPEKLSLISNAIKAKIVIHEWTLN